MQIHITLKYLVFCSLPALLFQPAGLCQQAPAPSHLVASQMGLLINDNDPYSVEVGNYYQTRRGIPQANVVHVSLPVTSIISDTQFNALKAVVDSSLPPQVQAIAVSWVYPFRIGFIVNGLARQNSMTAALSRGLQISILDHLGPFSCEGGATPSPYFDSPSSQPYTDLHMRPAMLLAAYTADQAKAMIDRGIASDSTFPTGSAYIMYSADPIRNQRAPNFNKANLGYALEPYVYVTLVYADELTNTSDALFYFAGDAHMHHIAQNVYPLGAIGDHMTSTGGFLPDGNGQTPILDWIAAGETGSFGTISEPCGVLTDIFDPSPKFPNPSVMVSHYTSGDTLIEAYWKSVLITFQGNWIGEPLAHPWSN